MNKSCRKFSAINGNYTKYGSKEIKTKFYKLKSESYLPKKIVLFA